MTGISSVLGSSFSEPSLCWNLGGGGGVAFEGLQKNKRLS
jgi:hypothetical protein